LGSFKERLIRFMYGRYGIDQLYYALLLTFFALRIINTSARSIIIDLLSWAILIWMIFRAFSRNIYKRRRENEKFMQLWTPIKRQGSLTRRRIKEIKTHRFRKCPQCRVMLRLPRKRGKHTVECPRCHKEFKLRILW
jgi:hypothetical protein